MSWPNRTTVAPTGWLLCNGSQYDSTNAEFWQLYQEIGNTYNTGGESANHFRVPNLQARLLMRGAAVGNQGQVEGSNIPNGTNNAVLNDAHLPFHNQTYTFLNYQNKF